MEETLDIGGESGDLAVNGRTGELFLTISKWGKFLAIVGFIFLGLMVLGAIAMLVGSSFIAANQPRGFGNTQAMPMTFASILYLLMAVLYFFPTLYLLKFSNKVKMAWEHKNQSDFDEAIVNLKSLFKFVGILTIVILGLYILMFLVGMLGAALV